MSFFLANLIPQKKSKFSTVNARSISTRRRRFDPNTSHKNELLKIRDKLEKKDPHRALFNSVIFGESENKSRISMPTNLEQLMQNYDREFGRTGLLQKDRLELRSKYNLKSIISPKAKTNAKVLSKSSTQSVLANKTHLNLDQNTMIQNENITSNQTIYNQTNNEVTRNVTPIDLQKGSVEPVYYKGVKLNPPGSRDAEMLGSWLGIMLLKAVSEGSKESLSPSVRFKRMEAVYTAGFKELCEQVRTNSNKRGELLIKIWEGYHTEIKQFYESLIFKKDNEISKLNDEISKLNTFMMKEVKELRTNFEIGVVKSDKLKAEIEDLKSKLEKSYTEHKSHINTIQ